MYSGLSDSSLNSSDDEKDVYQSCSESEKPLEEDEAPSVSSENKDSVENRVMDCPPIVDERIGVFLSSTPPVIENIFQNLGARDLNQCAKVCTTWSKLAHTEKEKRHSLFTFFQSLDKKVDPEKSDFVCKFVSEFPHRLDTALNNSYIEPHLVLIFTCSFLSKKKNRINDVKWIIRKLPKHCSVLCLSSYGVVGTPMSKILSYESENKSSISGLFFPKNIPGVEFYPFEIPIQLKRPIKGPKHVLTEEEIFNFTKIPPNKKVKCLLFFSNDLPQGYIFNRRHFTVSIADYFLKGNNFQIAVGGGVADAISYKSTDCLTGKSCSIGAGLVIAGDIVAASILIPMNTKSKDRILEKLKELKNGITLQKESIAFLFPCCARGSEYFDEKDVEPNLFHQIFPSVKLVGMFGNGEFGIDYLPNKLAPEKQNETYIHCYTSVFVILSWN